MPVALPSPTPVPVISRFVLSFFRRIVRGYFQRSFHAVRVSELDRFRSTPANDPAAGPLLIYANHGSWWDPMVSFLLAAQAMPGRRHFAPMDAVSLARYGILERIGVFGVELNSARGGAKFLRTSLTILRAGGVLWITPQGRFADVRERPLIFKPGLAALAVRVEGGCTVLPLAIEYTFWDERLPEVLLHFGEPVHVHGGDQETVNARLKAALETTMGALRTKSITRNPAEFTVLHAGSEGTGGFYQAGQKLLARLRGKTYQAAHSAAHGVTHRAAPGPGLKADGGSH